MTTKAAKAKSQSKPPQQDAHSKRRDATPQGSASHAAASGNKRLERSEIAASGLSRARQKGAEQFPPKPKAQPQAAPAEAVKAPRGLEGTKPDADFRAGYVGIVGRPNVGKSTLFNALIGMKIAITSRKAQTTRHRIRGVLTTPTAQLVFVDTPGLQHAFKSTLNRAMNRAVETTLADVDAIVWVSEATGLTDEDRDVLARLPAKIPVIAALNKVDGITDRTALLEHMRTLSSLRDWAAIVPLAATRDKSFKALIAETTKLLPVAPAIFDVDDVTDRSVRFLASEFIREKLFRLLGDELPYQTAVIIEKFEELPRLCRIHAAILVAKENQKAIVIGAKGESLKRIGMEARLDIEKLTGTKVHLELWVKVRSGWADSEAQLRSLGME